MITKRRIRSVQAVSSAHMRESDAYMRHNIGARGLERQFENRPHSSDPFVVSFEAESLLGEAVAQRIVAAKAAIRAGHESDIYLAGLQLTKAAMDCDVIQGAYDATGRQIDHWDSTKKEISALQRSLTGKPKTSGVFSIIKRSA